MGERTTGGQAGDRPPLPEEVTAAIATDLQRAERELYWSSEEPRQRAAGRLAGAAKALLDDSPGLAVHLAVGAWEELGELGELADHVEEHRAGPEAG